MSPQRRLQLRVGLQNGVFVLLLVALTAMLAWLAREHRLQWDLTTSGRNMVSMTTSRLAQRRTVNNRR